MKKEFLWSYRKAFQNNIFYTFLSATTDWAINLHANKC